MKKAIWGGIVVVAIILLGGYALWSASRSQAPLDTTPGGQVGGTSAGSETTNPNVPGGDTGGTGTTGGTTGGTSSAYKDGTYTGVVGSAAPYGQVQVSVTISGSKIASIQLLKAPSGPGNTNEITARTFPILIKEAIAIQSAKVNIVSGATQDSEGFQASLTSALTQAQS